MVRRRRSSKRRNGRRVVVKGQAGDGLRRDALLGGNGSSVETGERVNASDAIHGASGEPAVRGGRRGRCVREPRNGSDTSSSLAGRDGVEELLGPVEDPDTRVVAAGKKESVGRIRFVSLTENEALSKQRANNSHCARAQHHNYPSPLSAYIHNLDGQDTFYRMRPSLQLWMLHALPPSPLFALGKFQRSVQAQTTSSGSQSV